MVRASINARLARRVMARYAKKRGGWEYPDMDGLGQEGSP